MSHEPKHSTTPTDVNSDRTPITQRKVERVDPSTWETAPVGELYDQLSVLQSRFFSMQEMKKFEIAQQVNGYIAQLRQIIKRRETKQQRRFNVQD